ncbi:MAG: L-2-hydroxyglutarate oxidase [Planctomycetaceae bacterium]
MSALRADVAIIGGGIVGLATAYRVGRRFPHKTVVVLDKEAAVAQHQSGHNSGVLHSGIYYKPGSLKATNCRAGKKAMEAFCEAEGIPFERCGKVIVATSADEVPRLDVLYERGRANGVACELIEPERLRELEPHAAGIRAIHVPEAGIVDYSVVCTKLAEKIREAGGEILLNAAVIGIETRAESVIVRNRAGDVEAAVAVNCAGLHSDRIARMSGSRSRTKVIPFRGEYFTLKPRAEHLVNTMIYPVPDPRFPFLGVHFTKRIGGRIECGPNAVLAFAREGYTKTAVNLRDLAESLTYRGFLRMAATHWQTGLGEMWRSVSKPAFVQALQRLIPELTIDDLDAAPAGVRAQALSPDGTLVDDFLIEETGRVVNVLNSPSPAATSALNIGDLITDRLETRLA